MLDMGWTEILLIGVVALIVVGPKDLPRMLRTLGQYAGKLRGMAREFQRSMDDAAREADLEELKDVRKTLNEVKNTQYEAQRAMSQSFLDGPAKKDTPAKKASPEADAEKGAAKTSSTPAPAEPVTAEPAPAEPAPPPVTEEPRTGTTGRA